MVKTGTTEVTVLIWMGRHYAGLWTLLMVLRFAFRTFSGDVERGSRGRRPASADRFLGAAGLAGGQDTSAV